MCLFIDANGPVGQREATYFACLLIDDTTPRVNIFTRCLAQRLTRLYWRDAMGLTVGDADVVDDLARDVVFLSLALLVRRGGCDHAGLLVHDTTR